MLKGRTYLIAILGIGLFCSAVAADIYYVSPAGNDRHSGRSETAPFRGVQHAIDTMHAGDTLVMLDGGYAGTLQLKSGITIKAKHPRHVRFSGAGPVAGNFTKHAGELYQMNVGIDPKQLFYKNRPMSWARWPNLTWSENWIGTKKWAASATGSGPGKLKCDAFSSLKGLNLSGGYCFLRYSKGNSCYSRAIESFDGTTLRWNDTDFYSVRFSGEDGRRGSPAAIAKGKAKENVRARFFLAGALDLLDSEGEWFAKDGTLYFRAPGGGEPNAADVLIKTADYSIFDEQALSDVTLEGLDFFATSLKLDNPANNGITFRDVHFSYIGAEPLFVDNPQGEKTAKPIQVAGSNIHFETCLLAGGQNTGLKLAGSGLRVENCVFMENNRHANFQSVALEIFATGPFNVTRNTFFNNCSDAVRVRFDHAVYAGSKHPDISYNNICNAGLYNSDVSGVYLPNLSQHWTEVHHNWVHNVKGNGVRLDQAGEKLSVHHNLFWASKRGMNIEGYGHFNIYNNTSVLNDEPCMMTRNVVAKRKGTGEAVVSNDTSFPPISDWNILNNLVAEWVDRVGPSESAPFAASRKNGTLHPERMANAAIPMTDRGCIQGNLTGFKQTVFMRGKLEGLNLVPVDPIVKGGAAPTSELIAQGVTALDRFRGAYDMRAQAWSAGSDWLPYGLAVPETMAQAEAFAKKYSAVSIVPEIDAVSAPQVQ
jgi:hypothetical protein